MIRSTLPPGRHADHGLLLRVGEGAGLSGGAEGDQARRAFGEQPPRECFQGVEGHLAGGLERGDQGDVETVERHEDIVAPPSVKDQFRFVEAYVS